MSNVVLVAVTMISHMPDRLRSCDTGSFPPTHCFGSLKLDPNKHRGINFITHGVYTLVIVEVMYIANPSNPATHPRHGTMSLVVEMGHVK